MKKDSMGKCDLHRKEWKTLALLWMEARGDGKGTEEGRSRLREAFTSSFVQSGHLSNSRPAFFGFRHWRKDSVQCGWIPLALHGSCYLLYLPVG